MKKILCVFLSVVMILGMCLALVGCGPEDIRGDITTKPTENIRGEVSGDNNKPGETTAPTQPKETEPDFSMGKSTGNTYNNNFLGLSCTLPADWVFYTDEQIKQLNNVVGDYMDESVKDQLKNATVIYDMQAATQGSSVGVNMEKLNALQIAGLNIKQVLESQIPTIKDMYSQMGYTVTKAEYDKVTVDGKEFDCIKLTAKIQGMDFVLVSFAFRKSNYLATVTVGTVDASQLNAILGYFDVK